MYPSRQKLSHQKQNKYCCQSPVEKKDFKLFSAPEARTKLKTDMTDNLSAETMQDCSDNGWVNNELFLGNIL